MTRPKDGSRKASVYDAFHSGGYDEALRTAERLEIKEGTVRSWAGTWAKESGQKLPTRGSKVPATQEVPAPKRKAKHPGKTRVYFNTDSTLVGTLLQQGPQQSVISWDGQSSSDGAQPNHYLCIEGSGEPIPCECPRCRHTTTPKA
jgi:hypothetical protein